MRWGCILAGLCTWILWAGDSTIEGFHVPREFQEAEVQAEMDANWQASSGVKKINSFEVEWGPDKTILRGDPKQIQVEAQVIRESLSAFPFLAQFTNLVYPTDKGKLLDLTKLLKAIEKKLPQNCYNCFSLPLCAMKKKSTNMDFNDLLLVLDQSHEKKKEKYLGPGSVVMYRENYQMKEPYHAFIWLSPTLALEKRGSGFLLMRPQEVIEKEYKELASMERKSFNLMQGKKLPSLSTPLKKEFWVKK